MDDIKKIKSSALVTLSVLLLCIQRPYFYQTHWFAALMFALGFMLMFLIHRLRVAQISRSLSDRFEERFEERTNVTRDLHDNWLQTIQAGKMVAEHALKNPVDHARMVRAMGQLAMWLAQAVEEGHAA